MQAGALKLDAARPFTEADIIAARHALCWLDDGRAPVEDADAGLLVRQRGFALLGVVPKVGLPNLSAADESREWSVSWRAWRWKEVLPATRACAYLKWFRGQGTFISWDLYPSFYALWGPRVDGDQLYRAGLLSGAELDVLDVISEYGPISSRELWSRLRSRLARRTELLSALGVLQKRFFVSVAGGDLAGWSMHHWDFVPRCVPEGLLDALPDAAAAQENLVAACFRNLVCAEPREVARLFGWRVADVAATADLLAANGLLRSGIRVTGRAAPHYCAANT